MAGARILIVEDEFLVAANLESTLEDLGHHPIGIAPDLETARILARQAPDLALVDVNLRDGPTGALVAEHLTGLGVPVVFVTANPRMLHDSPPAAVGVLTKPCEDVLVGATVDYVLRSARDAPRPAPPAGLTLFKRAA